MIGKMRIGKLRSGLLFACAATSLLAGCASDGAGGGPTAAALPAGETCGSIKSQLNKLDARGVQAYVEAAGAGKKLPPSQKADADTYNRLLNEYLGARCHV